MTAPPRPESAPLFPPVGNPQEPISTERRRTTASKAFGPLVTEKFNEFKGTFEQMGAAGQAAGQGAMMDQKMSQKSAFVDAVIRTTGMSDLFTQDVEDMKDVPLYLRPFLCKVFYRPRR